MMNFPNSYIGLPWLELGRDRSGLDCYGLARLIQFEQRGITLPSFVGDYVSTEEHAEIADLIAGRSPGFVEEIPLHAARPLDLLLTLDDGYPTHIATVVERGRMIHIQRGGVSEAPRYDGPLWRNRIVGAYRVREAHRG